MKFRLYLFLSILAALFCAVSRGAPVLACAAIAIVANILCAPLQRERLNACPSAFEALRIATENLPNTIFRKASQRNFWTGYIDAEEFPRNKGVNQTVFVVGNSEPYSNAEAWTDLSLSSNAITAGGSALCTPSYTDVDVGYNERTFAPRRFGLAGPVICRETLGFAHDPATFLRQYQNELVKRAARTWEFELRNRAIRLFSKANAGPDFRIDTSGSQIFANFAPTSQLTLDMLDEAAQHLIEVGATDADQEWVELGPEGPIFPLVIGNIAAKRLLTNDSGIRQDYNYADMGKGPQAALLKRIGASRVLRNFRIVPTVLPPRYNFTAGAWVQVATYESVAGTEGTVARVSDDYHNALYEVAFIPHPMAFKKSVVRPDSAGLDWSPLNYMGEWTWLTGGQISTDYCFDPMKNYGRHFANFMYAPKPIFPEFGIAIIYKVCPQDFQTAACAPYS